MHEQLTERFLYYPETRRSGGTADVFEGVDLHNRGEKVAIKLVKEIVVTRELASLAFERESKCLSRLTHPNIVRWIDGGREEKTGRRYFVSEWLEYSLLEHLQAHQVLGWDDFFEEYASPILQALKYAYEQGVIHRDIKPSNIMVDPEATPKIIDFGIAGFSQAPKVGVTLATFQSVPYSPPDSANLTDDSGRDVWGFAASCIACINSVELNDYAELDRAFHEFDVPPNIDQVFERALSKEPGQRYLSILDFAADLESAQRKRQTLFSPLPDLSVFIANSAITRMQYYYPNASSDDLRKRIISDLNAEAAFRIKEESEHGDAEDRGDRPPDIEIVSGEHQYIASVNDRTGAPIVIKGMKFVSPFYADRFSQLALTPSIKFSLEQADHREDESEKALRLLSDIEDRARQLLGAREKEKEEDFFNTWRDILKLKTALADSSGERVSFDGREIAGRRVELHCVRSVDESMRGERRAIHLPNGYQIRGEVEDVSGSDIVIYLDELPTEDFPNSGILAADNAATKLAIQRQQGAIDAIRFGRNVGSKIKNALVHPEREPVSEEESVAEFMLSELDDPKKVAVSKGLGENAITLVQGPPGTGKTQLIVELILQLIRRDPRVRILLTSQTHIALDNVLERLLGEAPDVRAVRVGRASQKNRSMVVKPLMIEEIAERWKQETKSKSEGFLNRWAEVNAIDARDVLLGRAVSRYIAVLRESSKLSEQEAELETQIEEIGGDRTQTHSNEKGETAYEKSESEGRLKEERDEIQTQKRAVKQQVDAAIKSLKEFGADGTALVGLSTAELSEWEGALLGSEDLAIRFRRMLELSEEWSLRFSNSQELYPAILTTSQVVAGTCIGFAGAKGILDVEFDVCIIDEASKATSSEICVPISRADRAFIVGDHKQLPPFLEQGLLKRDQLERFGLTNEDVEETLFERLYRKLGDSHKVLLSKQYRMLPQIGDLISGCFYEQLLDSEPRKPKYDLSLAGIPKPVTWISTSFDERRREWRCDPGYKNILEAEVVRDMLKPVDFCLTQAGGSGRIALLSGYVEQREELRRQSNAVLADLESVSLECGTVDSFQGRQVDIAYFSVVRSNLRDAAGFLKEMRRLNVALSRAREALVIVGDFDFALSLPDSHPLRSVAEYISRHPEACEIRNV